MTGLPFVSIRPHHHHNNCNLKDRLFVLGPQSKTKITLASSHAELTLSLSLLHLSTCKCASSSDPHVFM